LNDLDHEGHDNAREDAQADDGFDLVFNCDCIYEHLYGKESWQALLQCQEVLLRHKPNTICITAVERRNGDGVDAYLQACAASQHIARVERVDLNHLCCRLQTGEEEHDIDDNNDTLLGYWARHQPSPEVEIYRAHGHAK
jgi:hypothetical protein